MTAPTAVTKFQLSASYQADPTDASSDATNGNVFDNTGVTMIRFNNTGGGAATVDFLPLDATGGARGEFTVGNETSPSIPAAGIRWVGRRELADFGKRVVFKTSATTLKFTVFEP